MSILVACLVLSLALLINLGWILLGLSVVERGQHRAAGSESASVGALANDESGEHFAVVDETVKEEF